MTATISTQTYGAMSAVNINASCASFAARGATAAALDPLTLARQLLDAGLPSRKVAQIVGMSDSTLRGRLKALTNGHVVEVEAN